jgi:hypothetical protein
VEVHIQFQTVTVKQFIGYMEMSAHGLKLGLIINEMTEIWISQQQLIKVSHT